MLCCFAVAVVLVDGFKDSTDGWIRMDGCGSSAAAHVVSFPEGFPSIVAESFVDIMVPTTERVAVVVIVVAGHVALVVVIACC
jgi:hypothetical protein